MTAPQRFEWHADEQPQLGDVALETPYPDGDPEEVRRAFLVVGIEETASRKFKYRLIFERVEWGTLPDDGRRFWSFHKIPRGCK